MRKSITDLAPFVDRIKFHGKDMIGCMDSKVCDGHEGLVTEIQEVSPGMLRVRTPGYWHQPHPGSYEYEIAEDTHDKDGIEYMPSRIPERAKTTRGRTVD